MKGDTGTQDDAAYQAAVLTLVQQASAAWVATWRDALARDGRAMEGGWPGTMGEARAWVQTRVAPELARRGLPFPTTGAVLAARDLYAGARMAWRSKALAERG
jgi:hypothetical protein